jgi:predicted ATP-dependent Lon-type protease
MSHNSTIISMAEEAANSAVDSHSASRGTHTWEIARDAALVAIANASASIEKLASEANINVPLAPGMPDGAAIARRSILDSIESFSKRS